MSIEKKLYNKFMRAVRKNKSLKKVTKHYRRYEEFVDFCKEKCFNYHHELEQEVQEKYHEYKERFVKENN